jgi:hypothetical protein
MTHSVPIEDPPAPDLDDLQQREPLVTPPVGVRVEGPVRTQILPSRLSSVTADVIPVDAATSTTTVKILNEDPRRQRAVIICEQDWFYRSGPTSTKGPIPKNIPIEVRHQNEVWASAQTAAGRITVISEFIGN